MNRRRGGTDEVGVVGRRALLEPSTLLACTQGDAPRDRFERESDVPRCGIQVWNKLVHIRRPTNSEHVHVGFDFFFWTSDVLDSRR